MPKPGPPGVSRSGWQIIRITNVYTKLLLFARCNMYQYLRNRKVTMRLLHHDVLLPCIISSIEETMMCFCVLLLKYGSLLGVLHQ